MRVIRLILELRTWGPALLMIFPARQKLRRVLEENDELSGRVRELEQFRGLALDVSESLHSAGERAGQSAS